MARLNLGVRIPSVVAPDMEDTKRFVQLTEALGFDSIWVGDHVFHHTDVLSPLEFLSWVAGITDRVGLGTSVVNAGYLHPVLLAKYAATVDYLSGGRLSLGLSIGGSAAEYNSLGVNMKHRVGRLIESIEVMRRLWREDDVEHSGRYFQVEGANLRPKPQRGTIPILLAAREDPMLDRVPKIADGWTASGHYTFDDFDRGVGRIRQGALALGRDADQLNFSKVQCVSVNRNHDEARRRASDHWTRYYGPAHDIDHATIYGTPAECAEQLGGFAGIKTPEVTLILEPTSMGPEELELLAEVAQSLSLLRTPGT